MSCEYYTKKYKKYDKKIKILLSQIGGTINYFDEKNDDFLFGWTKIKNSGQHNCGIFISDAEKNKIIKCDSTFFKKTIDMYLLTIPYHIFPHIYEIHNYQEKSYTIMEKLDGDISDFLLKYIPNIVLKQNDFDKSVLDLFILKTTRTTSDNKYVGSLAHMNYPSICSSINKNFREHVFSVLKEKNYDNPFVKINTEYNGTLINDYIYIENGELKNIDNLINQDTLKILESLQKYNCDFNQYISFFKLIKTEIMSLLPEILKIMFKLLYKLITLNLQYNDYKFDNFGYKIVDVQNNNTLIYNGTIIEIFILDLESGISNSDIDTEKNLVEIWNNKVPFGVYGGYTLNTVHSKIINATNLFFKQCLLSYGFSESLLETLNYNESIITEGINTNSISSLTELI